MLLTMYTSESAVKKRNKKRRFRHCTVLVMPVLTGGGGPGGPGARSDFTSKAEARSVEGKIGLGFDATGCSKVMKMSKIRNGSSQRAKTCNQGLL